MAIEAGRTLGEVGEAALLEVIRPYMAPASERLPVPVGDDAAVWAAHGDVVITTDSLVEDRHFHVWDEDAFYVDLGWKLLAVSLSDLAAMGAQPGPAFVTLALPRTWPVSRVESLYEGLRECADAHGALLAGGNLSDASIAVLTSTCLGTTTGGGPLTRLGARPGWLLAVTGRPGAAAAALRARHAADDPTLPPVDPELMNSWQTHLRRPEPRVAAGLALGGSGDVCAIDISDGLFVDASRLLAADGGGARGLVVDAGVIPIAPGVKETWPSDWLEVCGGGEDYELLFAAAPERMDALVQEVRATGIGATVIGEFDDDAGLRVRADGAQRAAPGGHQHFA